MKRLIVLFLLGFLLAPAFIYGQHHRVIVEPRVDERFVVGDMYYPVSYGGISLLMADIEVDNPKLYASLSPSFKNIEKKRNKAILSFATGGIIGSALVIGGFTFLKTNTGDSFWKPGDAFYDDSKNEKTINMGAIFGGMGFYAAGLLAGLIFSPKDADIYHFINVHNKNNPDQKMEWDLGFDLVQNKAPGLKLSLNF